MDSQDFVQYAQKLGYRRDVAILAEQRAGSNASLNTKMMHLLKFVELERRRSGMFTLRL